MRCGVKFRESTFAIHYLSKRYLLLKHSFTFWAWLDYNGLPKLKFVESTVFEIMGGGARRRCGYQIPSYRKG